MTDNSEQETKRPLSLARPGGRLELKKPIESGQVRQSFPHGRSKTVTVEVKKKRVVEPTVPPAKPGSPMGASPHVVTPVSTAPLSAADAALAAKAALVQAAKTQTAQAARQAVPQPVPPPAERAPEPALPELKIPEAPVQAEAPTEPSHPAPVPEPVVVEAPVPVVQQAEPVPPPAAVETPAEPVTAAPVEPPKPISVEPVAVISPPQAPIPVQTKAAPPVSAEAARPPQTNRGNTGSNQGRGDQNRGQQRSGGGKPNSAPSTLGTLRRGPGPARTLTEEERAARVKALQSSIKADEQARRQAEADALRREREAELERQRAEEEAKRRIEEEARRKIEEEARKKTEEENKRQKTEDESRREVAERAGKNAAAKVAALTASGKIKQPTSAAPIVVPDAEIDEAPKRGPGGVKTADARKARAPAPVKVAADQRRRTGKITISRALSDDEGERMRSLASVRRARERERLRMQQQVDQVKVVRDVIVPETITVQELAQRMAERGTDVIKALMRIGVMATLNQVIDADTAELVVSEFGHNLKRVAEADVEIGLRGEKDIDDQRAPRPPVVTIMGHVDHGKTSLLDALRQTDVVSGEAGGITQHIGAYQVTVKTGRKITFIDTPGHQAFTAMRARGANVTDIVVLVVAADDGLKEQTIEAIRHAKAAGAPIIVAINKIDKPGANPTKVREELLQHEIVVEEMGGDVLNVEVSALKKLNLDKLEEAILLQAEILDLRANPDRLAEGVVIEAKLERGRGAVATVLIQRGTLHVGDIFVTGGEWGRVRAMLDDRGTPLKEAGPGMPVEVLGLNGAPLAGDDFSVVDTESRARDIAEFRQRKKREAAHVAGARGTLEEMFSQIAAGTAKEMPVVVKSDVQGSLEAILASLRGLSTDEVAVRILNSGVGGISESDINLAHASNAVVIGFNVRANPQARDLARRDGVEIRYYSIIYDVIDDVRQVLQGMLAPTLREKFLGNAQIREVFDITKVGKVAGCYVTEGIVRRGSKVRLLRNETVIHEGSLKTLKRFKDEVKEVRDGYECGMAFENYTDIQAGDIIECFDVEEIARTL